MVPLRFGGANVSYRLALDVSSLQTVCCHDGGAKLSVRWPRGDKVVAGESQHMQYRSVTYSEKNEQFAGGFKSGPCPSQDNKRHACKF